MLTELVEYGHKREEEVKAMQSEIKKNIQGTNSKGKETGTHLMIRSRRKKETFNQQRMKKQEFQKNERLRNLQDTFKRSNVQIVDVPGREEEEQEVEQIMKENFPNLAKEIDFQEVQEAQSPKEVGPRKRTPRHIIITFPKIKEKERI